MNTRTKYKTKQRDILLECLAGTPGGHTTAADVCAYCRAKGMPVGQSTVYRQLENLVAEGLVNKYIIDVNSPACFEYVGAGAREGADSCFHCKCERCGALIHLHCDELAAIRSHLFDAHGFRLDPMRTVLYGLCEDCRANDPADGAEG